MLDDAAKRTAARIAVAEVQKQHAVWSMAQLRFEVHRALPVLNPGADGEAVVTEVAKLAVCGRAGTEVVQVTAPDITDVTSLGVRASDGGSIYRPPNEERYCTLAHLDTEEQILAAAKRTVPQLVSEPAARAAAERAGLNAEQRAVVVMMLTAAAAMTVLIAPAGAGKSHAMAEFARLWTTFTGRRVIGLTTSTNAARVLAHEGLAESYNIAEFLGKVEGSDELRRPVPLHQDDVLVMDEASQLSTSDLAMITEAARQAGARVIATGDTAQLGAVEAGGMFRLLAQEVPAARLHEVRRFTAEWERQASVRLRDGDLAAAAPYDRHGRIRGADEEAAYQRAAALWLADHLRGKDVLLLAGSNAEAAELSRRVQAKLVQMGTIGRPQATLADGNHAGVGDLVRARLNAEIDAGGRKLTNRDTLKVTALRGPDAEVRRQRLDGAWTGPFRVPRSYLAHNAELGYAGNVHVAQGRTVDTAHLLVTGTLSRQALYVGMTRGRESNTAHVVTGKTAPPGHEPYQQATPESVLAGVMQRNAEDLSATEQIRQAQEWAGGTSHLLHLWSAVTRQALYPDIDEQIKARLTGSEAWRYEREHSRKALQQRLRAAQLAGHDISALIDQITATPLDGAKSVSSVLHSRLQRLALPQLAGHDITWAQRTPASAPAVARELAAGLDDRIRALGERMAASPQPWLARQLGVIAPTRPPRCARNTPAARAWPPPTGKPPESPTPNKPFHCSRTAATPSSRTCARQPLLRWRYATRQPYCAALTVVSWKPRSSPGNALRPVPRRTRAGLCGSPRRPKPTPCGNPPTPKSSTTKPARPAPRRSPSSWPPNGSGSKPATPDTRCGPPAPATSEKQLAGPVPNSSAAGMPGQRRNRSLRPTRNRRRQPDGGASSKQISRPSNAPSPASTRPPSTPANPGRRSAHPSWIPGRPRRPARKTSPRLSNPRNRTGRRG